MRLLPSLLFLVALVSLAAPAVADEFAPIEEPERAARIKPRLVGLNVAGGTLVGIGGVGIGAAVVLQALEGDYSYSNGGAALFFAGPFTLGTGVALLIGAAVEAKKAKQFMDVSTLPDRRRIRRMRAASIVWTVSGSLLLAGGVGMGTAGLAEGDFAGLLVLPGVVLGAWGGAFLAIGQTKAGKLLRVRPVPGEVASATPAQRAWLQWGMTYGVSAR